jgi:hypothetical protein
MGFFHTQLAPCEKLLTPQQLHMSKTWPNWLKINEKLSTQQQLHTSNAWPNWSKRLKNQ